MKIKKRIWLIIEKSQDTKDQRASTDYQDITGKLYNYDSNVANFKNVKENDILILRKENTIHGFGKICKIISEQTKKKLQRCSKCNTTNIRAREKSLSPLK